MLIPSFIPPSAEKHWFIMNNLCVRRSKAESTENLAAIASPTSSLTSLVPLAARPTLHTQSIRIKKKKNIATHSSPLITYSLMYFYERCVCLRLLFLLLSFVFLPRAYPPPSSPAFHLYSLNAAKSVWSRVNEEHWNNGLIKCGRRWLGNQDGDTQKW